MKKLSVLALVCGMLTLLLSQSYTEEITIGSDIVFPENTVTFVGETGMLTPGLTFIVHDVRYDGYRLSLSITSAPNVSGYIVYNDVPGKTYSAQETDELNVDNLIPIGAHCAIQVLDEDENEINTQILKSGLAVNSTFIFTFLATLPLERVVDEVRVRVAYGMMETLGELLNNPKTFDLLIPVQAESTAVPEEDQ